ncbi:peptidoglycan binding domain-containing protein [Roseibium sp. TrichSKD4]|uniref:N-acetylmuramidase domain-containing protein n=1 Tax=Roseibium sp. TrichSKD4 TaxID=744980 RepID=UPI0001E569AF|nr:N-acetylmuramidase domain-containing protein [Roseibium sp. TrichSKD4]EFO32482.1 peptidoglycan binding domain-containing protein [Roseibium sp. TrichSKD4]
MSIVQTLRQGGGETLDIQPAIDAAALRISCSALVLGAIIQVESGGKAYDSQGRLIILPERHIFYRKLPKGLRGQAMRMGLAVKRWSRANYRGLGKAGSDARWELMEDFAKVNEEAALQSASYGGPQIMGFNYKVCGYASVTDFVLAFAENNLNQIDAFIRFLERSGLSQDLREADFEAIARRYNGPGQVKHYAALMRRAYAKLGGDQSDTHKDVNLLKLGSEGYRVEALQKRLASLGYTLRPDGDFGPATKRAVVGFQVDHGLTPDGVVGPKTQEALEAAVPVNQQPGSSREGLTVKDLRKSGSQTVKNADRLTQIGAAVIGTSAAATGLEETGNGVLGGLGEVTNTLQAIRAQVEPLLELISQNRWMAFAAIGLAVVIIANRIKARRLEDARNWRHLG